MSTMLILFTINDIILSSSFGKSQSYKIENNEAKFNVIPNEFKLHPSYPNPFNPTTMIPYDIAKEALVTLTIIDILGREVATLVNENKRPGKYQILWNGRSKSHTQLPTGVYFVQLKANEFVSINKITLLK